MNQFATHWTDAASSKDLARGRIRQEFHKAILRFHDQRFAMISERIPCHQIGDISHVSQFLI